MRGRYASKRAKYFGGQAVSEHTKIVDPAPSEAREIIGKHRVPDESDQPLLGTGWQKTCALCGRTGTRGYITQHDGRYVCSSTAACNKRQAGD